MIIGLYYPYNQSLREVLKMSSSLIYIALSFFLNFFLSFRIIGLRRKLKIGIGTGGNEELARAVRAHGNLVEHAPFILLMLFILDVTKSSFYLVHALGFLFILGRLLHAWGISHSVAKSNGRFFGTLLTFLVGLTSAVILVVKAFS